MIRFASEKDSQELLDLCIQSFPMKDHTFLDYYFKHLFHKSRVLISELDNKLVSQIHINRHVLHYRDKLLSASYLSNISTHYDYRNRGVMRELMEMVLEDCSNNDLLTFISAVNPKMFEKYGFEVISKRKNYVIYARDMLKYNSKGVCEKYNVQDLVRVYKKFMTRFDCYYDRDASYYERYIEYVKESGGHICVYRDKYNEVCGYSLYYEYDDSIEIKEIVYLNSNALIKMIKYAMQYNTFISVEVSYGEKLEKLFKMSIPRSYNSVMVRINNIHLYNKLFNCTIKNAKELEKQLGRPVWLHEKM